VTLVYGLPVNTDVVYFVLLKYKLIQCHKTVLWIWNWQNYLSF